jgi:hypothetical protein
LDQPQQPFFCFWYGNTCPAVPKGNEFNAPAASPICTACCVVPETSIVNVSAAAMVLMLLPPTILTVVPLLNLHLRQ